MVKQDEALRQQARQLRKMATIERASQLIKNNPGMSRLDALAQAVTEARDAQNSRYSDTGKSI